MRVIGVRMKNINHLVDKLYKITKITINNPIIFKPSCVHYNDVNEMTTPYCAQCGKYNNKIQTGGDSHMFQYELNEFVGKQNNFIESHKSKTHDFILEHVTKTLKNNNWSFYIYNIKYDLVASYVNDDDTPMVLWVDYKMNRISKEDILDRFREYDKTLNGTFIIYIKTETHICNGMLKLMMKSNVLDGEFVESDAIHYLQHCLGEEVSGIFIDYYNVHERWY